MGGAIFCAAAGLGGADSLCVTQGCALYHSVQLFGFSLWWWGAAAFAFIGILCISGLLRYAFYVSFAALAVDCFLLAWMAASLPCINCLAAALLFLSLFLCLHKIVQGPQRLVSPLLCIWLMLFSPNVFTISQELLGPWAIRGSNTDPVRVFFSPSCAACRTTLQEVLRNGERNLAFYPIAENDDDVLRLHSLQALLDSGEPFSKAFAASRDPLTAPDMTLTEEISLRLQLMRNKLALARMGAPKIPVIVMIGMPPGFGKSQSSSGQRALDFSSGEEFSGCTQLPGGKVDCDQ